MTLKNLRVILIVGLFLALSGTALASWAPSSPNSTPRALAPKDAPYLLYLPYVVKDHLMPAPLWRFGVAKQHNPLASYSPNDVMSLRPGWYVDWYATFNAPQPYGIEYVPTVRVKQGKIITSTSTLTFEFCAGCPYADPPTYTVSPPVSQILATAANRPGMTWIIGNEIERRDWLNSDLVTSNGQDEILPELYAAAYHELYYAIKGVDPIAQIAIGGMVEATPLRLKYLDRVWNTYILSYTIPMTVEVWNIHGFVLQERKFNPADQNTWWGADIPAGLTETVGTTYSVTDNKNFNLLASQIVAFRNWMTNHGQQSKPLIISEYGVLFPEGLHAGFTSTDVKTNMMYPSFDYFRNTISTTIGYPTDGYRLVQRWNWYSLDGDDCCLAAPYTTTQYYNGNLMYSGLFLNPMGLAPLGNYWKQYVQPLPPGSIKPY